jgi:hypothetical protein
MKPPEHRVLRASAHTAQAEAWCFDQWGERWSAISNREGRWCVFYRGTRTQEKHLTYEWLFADEKDATMFALRWL